VITFPFGSTIRALLVPESNIAKAGKALCTIKVEDDGPNL
jgi:hypothetical protein